MGCVCLVQVHALNQTMMEMSREMMKAGIIDEVPFSLNSAYFKFVQLAPIHRCLQTFSFVDLL